MSRWKASAIHLLISAIVVGSVVLAVTLIWYPPAIWRMAGVVELLGIVIAVDLVLGPLLTLIVFRAGKPSLRFDLTVIALLQAAALAYALHTIWVSRPVYVVGIGNVGRFHLVYATDLDDNALDSAKGTPYEVLPAFGPKLVGAKLPMDQALRQNLLWQEMAGNELQFQPRYFVPYDQVQHEMGTVLRSRQARDEHADLSECIAPYVSRRGSAGMQVDCQSGAVVGPIATTATQADPEKGNK